jgi:hypothetical protein
MTSTAAEQPLSPSPTPYWMALAHVPDAALPPRWSTNRPVASLSRGYVARAQAELRRQLRVGDNVYANGRAHALVR